MEKIRTRERERRSQVRKSVVQSLGGKCCKCGFSDERALQIDHVVGDGNLERTKNGYRSGYYVRVLVSFLKKENKYQLLCANCNWIKKVENKEHRKNKNKL